MFNYFLLINNDGEYFYIGFDDYYTGFYNDIECATIFTDELYNMFSDIFDLHLCKKVYIDFIYSL